MDHDGSGDMHFAPRTRASNRPPRRGCREPERPTSARRRPETWRTWPRCTAGTADVSQAPTGNVAHLAAVRLAGQDGFDRLVLEFADRVPGPGVDVLSGCGGSHTRSAACQQLAKTGTNRMDRTTQTGHADFADLDVRDAAEH